MEKYLVPFLIGILAAAAYDLVIKKALKLDAYEQGYEKV